MSEMTLNLWLLLAVTVSAVAFLQASIGPGGATGCQAGLALVGAHFGSRRWSEAAFGPALSRGLMLAARKLQWSAIA